MLDQNATESMIAAISVFCNLYCGNQQFESEKTMDATQSSGSLLQNIFRTC